MRPGAAMQMGPNAPSCASLVSSQPAYALSKSADAMGPHYVAAGDQLPANLRGSDLPHAAGMPHAANCPHGQHQHVQGHHYHHNSQPGPHGLASNHTVEGRVQHAQSRIDPNTVVQLSLSDLQSLLSSLSAYNGYVQQNQYGAMPPHTATCPSRHASPVNGAASAVTPANSQAPSPMPGPGLNEDELMMDEDPVAEGEEDADAAKLGPFKQRELKAAIAELDRQLNDRLLLSKLTPMEIRNTYGLRAYFASQEAGGSRNLSGTIAAKLIYSSGPYRARKLRAEAKEFLATKVNLPPESEDGSVVMEDDNDPLALGRASTFDSMVGANILTAPAPVSRAGTAASPPAALQPQQQGVNSHAAWAGSLAAVSVNPTGAASETNTNNYSGNGSQQQTPRRNHAAAKRKERRADPKPRRSLSMPHVGEAQTQTQTQQQFVDVAPTPMPVQPTLSFSPREAVHAHTAQAAAGSSIPRQAGTPVSSPTTSGAHGSHHMFARSEQQGAAVFSPPGAQQGGKGAFVQVDAAHSHGTAPHFASMGSLTSLPGYSPPCGQHYAPYPRPPVPAAAANNNNARCAHQRSHSVDHPPPLPSTLSASFAELMSIHPPVAAQTPKGSTVPSPAGAAKGMGPIMSMSMPSFDRFHVSSGETLGAAVISPTAQTPPASAEGQGERRPAPEQQFQCDPSLLGSSAAAATTTLSDLHTGSLTDMAQGWPKERAAAAGSSPLGAQQVQTMEAAYGTGTGAAASGGVSMSSTTASPSSGSDSVGLLGYGTAGAPGMAAGSGLYQGTSASPTGALISTPGSFVNWQELAVGVEQGGLLASLAGNATSPVSHDARDITAQLSDAQVDTLLRLCAGQ